MNNLANLVREQAQKFPNNQAVVFPYQTDAVGRYAYTQISFAEFERQSDYLAYRFAEYGIKRQDKVLLFVRPSLEFCLVALTLFKMGCTAVLIDPGMGRKNLLKAVAEVEPDVLIAVPEIHWARLIFRKAFNGVSKFISVDGKKHPLNLPIEKLKKQRCPHINGFMLDDPLKKVEPYPIAQMSDEELAGIFFTSGGTGKPKGVCYTHTMFLEQIRVLKSVFGFKPGERDMPGFPLFALFSIAQGMTAVIPDMDPTKPSQADPKKLYQTIIDHQVDYAGGSPAIWRGLGNYCTQNNLTLDSMRALMMFGAPVAADLHSLFKPILPNGTVITPYGATECLPISYATSKMILGYVESRTRKGGGTCIGQVVEGLQVKIVKYADQEIKSSNELQELGPGEIGEILVRGRQVTRTYYKRPEANLKAKVKHGDTSDGHPDFWHRMGDFGYLDAEGKLWFCGRVAHSFEYQNQRLFSVPTEAIFNEHPNISKTALVKVKVKENGYEPALVVQEKPGVKLDHKGKSELKQQLLTLAKTAKHTQVISKFYVAKEFPVDVRHNIKIDRKKLGQEAEEKLQKL